PSLFSQSSRPQSQQWLFASDHLSDTTPGGRSRTMLQCMENGLGKSSTVIDAAGVVSFWIHPGTARAPARLLRKQSVGQPKTFVVNAANDAHSELADPDRHLHSVHRARKLSGHVVSRSHDSFDGGRRLIPMGRATQLRLAME